MKGRGAQEAIRENFAASCVLRDASEFKLDASEFKFGGPEFFTRCGVVFNKIRCSFFEVRCSFFEVLGGGIFFLWVFGEKLFAVVFPVVKLNVYICAY